MSAELPTSYTERLKEQFLLVNATVSKFLKQGQPEGHEGEEESTIHSMRQTLCRLAKESARLQTQLEATLKDEKLYEVKYKALHLEAQKTWKSGISTNIKTGDGSETAGGQHISQGLENAEEQAKTGRMELQPCSTQS